MKHIKRWARKGAKLTQPCKDRFYVTQGRGKNKEFVATNAYGAMRIGYACEQSGRKTRSYRTVRFFSEGVDSYFWQEMQWVAQEYFKKYGNYIEQDNLEYGREHVIKNILRLG